MRILLLGLLFFAFQAVVYAQDIHVPFKGEKVILKIKDINNKDGYIDRIGNKCGDYFLYQKIQDQKIVSFGLPLTKDEYGSGVEAVQRFDLTLLIIKPDDNVKVPTAEWHRTDNHYSLNGGWRVIIRISNKDYKEAKCLPKPSKQLLD